MNAIVTCIRLLTVVLAAVTIIGAGQPAVCQENGCPNLGCNEELPCPGANCGCVQRPGQPFGRCVPY